MERYYTVSEISERTGIPRRTLYDAINAGRLAALVPNGCRRGVAGERERVERVRETEHAPWIGLARRPRRAKGNDSMGV